MALIRRRAAKLRLAALLRRHPELSELQWKTCTLSEAPLGAISGVIQSAWQRAYGDRIRIAFSPEFFQYLDASARNAGRVTFAEDQEGVCGVLVGVPIDWADVPQADRSGLLSTGLSTTARWEGTGLIDMLLTMHALNQLEAGHAFSLHWRATESQQGNAPRSLHRAQCIPLFAKPLRCAQAIQRGGLSWWQGLGVRCLALRHPVRTNLPPQLSVSAFAPGRATDYATFLNEFQPENKLQRRFFPETIQKQCTFVKGALRGLGLTFYDGDSLAGMIWGYVNPVDNNNAAYFAIDGAIFHPSLPASHCLHCLQALEAHVRDDLDCFAVLVPASVCRLPLGKRGYIPVRRYALGGMNYHECPQATPESIGNSFIELR